MCLSALSFLYLYHYKLRWISLSIKEFFPYKILFKNIKFNFFFYLQLRSYSYQVCFYIHFDNAIGMDVIHDVLNGNLLILQIYSYKSAL